MAQKVMPQYLAYCALHVVLAPFLGIRSALRAKKRVYNGLIWRRLSGGSKPPAKKRWVVLIGGGLGEIRVAAKVAEELTDALGVPVYIFTQNRGGIAPRFPRFATGIAPFNNPISTWLFLRRWNPRTVWVVEFWDNHHLKVQSAIRGIPTVVFNVPIMESATLEVIEKPNTWWRWLPVGLYAVQHERHRERLKRFNVPDDQIEVAGLLGFGVPAPQGDPHEIAAKWRQELGIVSANAPVIVAGSTWPLDEEAVLDAFEIVRQRVPNAVLVLAPRRVREHATTLSKRGLSFLRRSDRSQELPDSRIVLLDTKGELRDVYSIASAAFVGGTYDPSIGGHTPIEALSWNVPLTIGPSFAQHVAMVELLQERGCLVVTDSAQSLAEAWLMVMEDPERLAEIRGLAAQVVREQSGKAVELYRSLGIDATPEP